MTNVQMYVGTALRIPFVNMLRQVNTDVQNYSYCLKFRNKGKKSHSNGLLVYMFIIKPIY